MGIEEFVNKSEGEWRSMRSGHSLAFRQFEQVISSIKISSLSIDDKKVVDIINTHSNVPGEIIIPFSMEWEAESDWENENISSSSSGSTILIPFAISTKKGYIIRSEGYTEKMKVLSYYSFLSDGTLLLSTEYQHTVSEERIWFIAEHVRCRSSVTKDKKSLGILQTSFASEVRRVNNSNQN